MSAILPLGCLIPEMKAIGLRRFIEDFDHRREGRDELVRRALRALGRWSLWECREFPPYAATLLLQEAVLIGELAAVEYLLHFYDANRVGPCFGRVDPDDGYEASMRCYDSEPCVSCQLTCFSNRTRRRTRPESRQISDWLWARCACSHLWSGRSISNWRGPGHPILKEIIASPELPKIVRWLRRAYEFEEDRLSIEEAVQQCDRWGPRAAWVAAVLRARPRPAGAASEPK